MLSSQKNRLRTVQNQVSSQILILSIILQFVLLLDTYPLCLGCYTAVDCSVTCSVCGWPVCGPECEAIPAHKNAECSVFSKACVKFQVPEDPTAVCLQYECITPLR